MQVKDFPGSVSGTVKVLPNIWSRERRNARDIFVYLPPSYERTDRRFPVVYVQDGQNLFDDSLAFGSEWQVDEHMERLSRLSVEAIVVGIANPGAARCDEYSPFVDAQHGGGGGDEYLDFVERTVKPAIDELFRTDPSRGATGILGSSMGAVISLYAFFTRPQVFSFAGAMSPAFWFADRALFTLVEQASFTPGRIYIDVGTGEGDSAVADAQRMHQLLVDKGYVPGESLMYVEDDGAPHSEEAWARRVRTALYYLIPAAAA
jgi:predicted alpha/beta superfamily hydrolase